MDRRMFAGAGALLILSPALAHHGWSSFDTNRPIYLEGRVTRARWQNPHAELEIEVPARLQVPADLKQRAVPAQQVTVDGGGLFAAASPPTRSDRLWTIELAPISRMNAWKVAEIKPGASIAVVGFTFSGEKGAALVRAEYLFAGGSTYGLRSGPA